MNQAELEEPMRAVVDDRLLDSYAESVEALGTPDLVLQFDQAAQDVRAFIRTKFATDYAAFLREKNLPDDDLLGKVVRVASSTARTFKGPLAFWLIVTFADGEMATVAVAGQRIGTGSVAVS